MARKDNLTSLIQLLASYRRAEFPHHGSGKRSLAAVARTIENNCRLTIHFAGQAMRDTAQDCEGLFALHALNQEALHLTRCCRNLRRSPVSAKLPQTIGSLQQHYGIFVSSVRHLFFLLDRDLARRLDGAL